MAADGFPARLKDARVHRGLSQTQLAFAVEVQPGQINRYEQAVNDPRERIKARLADVLKVPLAWLIDGVGEPFDEASKVNGGAASILANRAVDVVAAVRDMSFDAEGAGLAHEEVLRLQGIAEQILKSAFSQVEALVGVAQALRAR